MNNCKNENNKNDNNHQVTNNPHTMGLDKILDLAPTGPLSRDGNNPKLSSDMRRKRRRRENMHWWWRQKGRWDCCR
jgi:hypothetical protein